MLSYIHHLIHSYYSERMWYYFSLYYMFNELQEFSLLLLLPHSFMLMLHFMLTNSLSFMYFIHLHVRWNHVLLSLHLSMWMLHPYLLHFMHYPLLWYLLSDFILCSDLIHNLLHFHILHLPNCMLSFHTLDLDHSHLHFMLFYYIHFLSHLLLLRLVLYDLYLLLHYLYILLYFMHCRLSLHYMLYCMHLYYNFILLWVFMLHHYLYFLPMSQLHFMSYNYSMLGYMSMFHMLALPCLSNLLLHHMLRYFIIDLQMLHSLFH